MVARAGRPGARRLGRAAPAEVIRGPDKYSETINIVSFRWQTCNLCLGDWMGGGFWDVIFLNYDIRRAPLGGCIHAAAAPLDEEAVVQIW